MITDIQLLKEQLQENLISFLDGMPDETLDGVCQIVIETIDGGK
jgi:hypothetical protein